MTETVPPQREQNFYPLSHLPLFRQLIDEQLEHEHEQLASLQQAESRPYILDDATVNRVVKLYSEAQILKLAKSFEGKTIEQVMSKSDLEVGLEFFSDLFQ